jgi:hypothetical protein
MGLHGLLKGQLYHFYFYFIIFPSIKSVKGNPFSFSLYFEELMFYLVIARVVRLWFLYSETRLQYRVVSRDEVLLELLFTQRFYEVSLLNFIPPLLF